jgi:hypothetical protein
MVKLIQKMHYTDPDNFICRERFVKISNEPPELCLFTSLQTCQYSSKYIRDWSSRATPEYCWSHNGITADPIETFILRDVIILRDSPHLFFAHEGFLYRAPSYSSKSSEEYHERLYPDAHGYECYASRIRAIGLEDIQTHQARLIFPLLWHKDHCNFWHFTFDIAFRLFYLKITHPYLLNRLELLAVGVKELNPFQREIIFSIIGEIPRIIYAEEVALIQSALFIPPTQTLLPRKKWLNLYANYLSISLQNISKKKAGESRLQRYSDQIEKKI